MIVKNEKHVIERALRSAAPFVTCYSICDTGSTDGTQDIIRKTMEELNIPGQVLDRPWVGFGHNRSESLEESRNLCPTGWSWVLDADDTIEGSPPSQNVWDSIKPETSALFVRIHHGAIKHRRTQIFRNTDKWGYKGAVHEYPARLDDGPETQESLPETCWHQARCEGARSADPLKYVRDAMAIKAELRKTPGEPRSLFYLAQSFRDSELNEESKAAYKERIKVGGWYQEQYMSYVALIKMAPTIEEKMELCWKALEIDKERLEAPFFVLSEARKQDKFSQQLYALGCVVENRTSKDHFLFSEYDIYNWQYDDELAVISYWTGHNKKAAEAALNSLKACPEHAKERIQKNVNFALDKLKSK
jgi:glycosyltransferase involved in cell wall biosynthesis